MTTVIDSLDEISCRFEAVFCDLWGCLHNGIRPFPSAVQALDRFRRRGGYVVLLTNAPRSRSRVIRQLDQIGVPRDLYDDVVTSGDAARRALALGEFGRSVHHIGPRREETFFNHENEDGLEGLGEIMLTTLEAAQGLVCTGLADDTTETPQEYLGLLRSARDRHLKMLCANPDLMVDRGSKRVYCAGAIAALYSEIGGHVSLFGKPHKPIYATARLRMNAAMGRIIEDRHILCIGDGIHTDIEGAVRLNLPSLFVTGGLSRTATATTRDPDRIRLESFLAEHASEARPDTAIGHLR